jgi:hypothetical protein
MDEAALIEKLIKIEAIFAGATTEGERISAERARQRILLRLKEVLKNDPAVEYKFTFPDIWSRKVFVALLRRYTLKPYRYSGQRYTTVMVQVPKSFVDETLWPEFQKINSELLDYLQAITDRVVSNVLHADKSEAVIVEKPLLMDVNQDPIFEDPINDGHKASDPSSEHRKNRTASKRKKKHKKKKNRKR